MISKFDYISIGTVGFAQVGNPNYHNLANIEKDVISEFYNTQEKLKVPEEFSFIARFKWVWCPHDIADYQDFHIVYDRDTVDEWEYSDNEDEYNKYTRFYDWVNDCESAIGEHEEKIMEWCNMVYRDKIKMEVVHKKIEGYTGLKIA